MLPVVTDDLYYQMLSDAHQILETKAENCIVHLMHPVQQLTHFKVPLLLLKTLPLLMKSASPLNLPHEPSRKGA